MGGQVEQAGPARAGPFGQGGGAALLKARAPSPNGIAAHGVGGSQLVQAQATAVTEHGLGPFALAGMGPGGRDLFQCLFRASW